MAVIALQQIFFMWQIQKLVDKAMSGSYTEYVNATKEPLRVQTTDEPPEDLRTLQEFQL